MTDKKKNPKNPYWNALIIFGGFLGLFFSLTAEDFVWYHAMVMGLSLGVAFVLGGIAELRLFQQAAQEVMDSFNNIPFTEMEPARPDKAEDLRYYGGKHDYL